MMQHLLASVSASRRGPSDPLFADVEYLNNDWTTAGDEGPDARTVTAVGTPTPDDVETLSGQTTVSLGGTEGYTVDGSESVASIANTDDFTLEAWARPSSLATNNVILGKQGAFGTGSEDEFRLMLTTSGVVAFFTFNNGTLKNNINTTGTLAVSVGEWVHVAVVRSSEVYFLYVDGVLMNPGGTASAGLPSPGATVPLQIGYLARDSSWSFTGNIGPVRFTKAARYPGEFTPETTFPAV